VLERKKKAKQHVDFVQNRFGLHLRADFASLAQFCSDCVPLVVVQNCITEKETLVLAPKRLQIQYIWILGVQEIVLFVLGGVLELLPKFSLHV
jgi:hypothetical protein